MKGYFCKECWLYSRPPAIHAQGIKLQATDEQKYKDTPDP